MATRLSRRDRKYLEHVVGKTPKPTRRQKARALLDFTQGLSLPEIAARTGIAEGELARLLDLFDERGLAGLGLAPPSRTTRDVPSRLGQDTIESTPDVCGGSARISGTRIPVWALVEARDLGVTEAQILLDYPALTALNLVDAWDYARSHRAEIDAEIHRNAVA